MTAGAQVDLERYPITRLDGEAGRDLIARGRRALAEDGALSLAGFIRPEAQGGLAAEARRLSPLAHLMAEDHTVYFEPPEPGLPPDHPRRRLGRTEKGGVAYDRIPADAGIRRLYEWDALTDFIAALIGAPRLYRHADPLAALNVNVFGAGQGLDWHFDRTDFSVTLSLQTPAAGGAFEYLPRLRSETEPNYDAVTRLLDGEDLGARTLPFAAGTLALFQGRHSPHRVTPVVGGRDRLVAVLSYTAKPGVTFSPYAQRLFYGRAAAPAGSTPAGSTPAGPA